MKKLKRLLALVMAMAMVVAMALPSFAAAPEEPVAPTLGSITINSPIVGATYKLYKIFDMTTNVDVNAFSYTIDVNNDFYGAVVDYASKAENGLILSRIKDSSPATYNVSVDESKFDAQAFGKAMQAAVKNGSPKVENDTTETSKPGTGIVAKDKVDGEIAEKYSKVAQTSTGVTADPDTSDYLKFGDDNLDGSSLDDGIDLGYYLINPTYPKATGVTVTMGSESFTVADLKKNAENEYVNANDEVVELKDAILSDNANTKINNYVLSVVGTDANDYTYVNEYLKDNGITTNPDSLGGGPLTDAGRAAYRTQLIDSMTANAKERILDQLKNTESGPDSDINVKDPTMVFLDSSQPDAVINEKNELDKWDVPVNPTGEAEPGTPQHGEPKGGKNIVAGVDKDGNAIYADWADAEIGESVHYQLRVNATNFIRKDLNPDDADNTETNNQVKEYILADFNSAHMHYDESKGIHVSIWQGDNENKTQDSEKDPATDAPKNVTVGVGAADVGATFNSEQKYLDYSNKKDVFFKNKTTEDGTVTTLNNDIFSKTEDGTGIVIPWVTVSQENLSATYPVYTTTKMPKENGGQPVYKTEKIKKEGTPATAVPYKMLNESQQWVAVENLYVSENNHVVFSTNPNAETGVLVDTNANGTLKTEENGNYVYVKETEDWHTYSLYNSDVTIVVDYWMILDDKAIVDEPGNKNFAQFGWNPVEDKDEHGNPKKPTNPDDEDKPSQKEKVDEATVYTYALAWVKIDEKGNELKDAEFKLPFYVKAENGVPIKDNNGAYIFAFALRDAETGKIKTDEKGNPVEATTETYPEDKSKPFDQTAGTYPKFSASNTTNVITTDKTGVITIKGVEQGTYSFTETKAPKGFNRLTTPFDIEAKKTGEGVTTKTKTTVYFDANGNVTKTVTNATKEYTTNVDSYNNENAADNEEKSVPVYQFNPIVNKQGTELPSTGGIGTTIFYVVGAILVIGAGVVLITKRRMDA